MQHALHLRHVTDDGLQVRLIVAVVPEDLVSALCCADPAGGLIPELARQVARLSGLPAQVLLLLEGLHAAQAVPFNL